MAEPETLPPRRRPPPEAAGPGTDAPDGSVTYGVDARPTVVVPPSRPAWEREADRAAAAARVTGCSRCDGIPADVVESITRALAAAKAGGTP